MTAQGWRYFFLLVAAWSDLALGQVGDSGDGDALGRQREAFRLAYERAQAGESPSEPDSEALRAYPLYPYLQAQRIAGALAEGAWSNADEAARAFLLDYASEPVGSSLRRAWLSSLARREQWETFLEHYAEAVADARLRCQYLAARVALEEINGIAPLIIAEWLTPRQLPIECEPVFSWLRGEGPLTEDLIERRVRLLLDNGEAEFARVIAGRLPEERAAPLLRWAELIERPAEAIDAHIVMLTEDVEPSALLDGWSRLARNDPLAALERFGDLIGTLRLDREQASPFALALALGLAWDRRPQALELFDRVASSDLDDYALGWRARAALWVGDWGLVGDSIAAMSERERGAAGWRYWGARAAEARRDRQGARVLFESVLREDNYYSAMAAARLRRRVDVHPEPLPLDSSRIAGVATQTSFVRARELFHAGLNEEAMREWRHGFSRLGEEAQRQSIHLAASWRRYDLAVATATRFGVFNDYGLLYPRPFDREVLAAVRSTELAPELVFGVIRQESLYRVDAVSTSGARGLMQLLPGTAERAARALEDMTLDHSDLFDPSINIRLGATELGRLVERYDGQLPVALAAYNAGPNAADRWLPEDPLEADIWIENIPYNETRAYVRRVLWHSVVFRWLETRRGQNIRHWSEPVSRQSLDIAD